IARGELREAALPPTLRHVYRDRPIATRREELRQRFAVGQRRRRHDLRWERAGERVVKAEERCDDLSRRRALRSLEREVIASDDGAVAHTEGLDDGVALRDGGGEHVEVVALVRVHLLAVEGPLDRAHAVAEHGRALEVERL